VVGFVVAFRGLLEFEGRSTTPYRDADAIFFSPSGSSPYLIYLLTAFFLYRRRQRLRASFSQPSLPLVGGALLALGTLLCGWSHYTHALELLIPALSLVMLGSGALLGGREGVRALRMPAAFLLLAMPIPVVILNYVMHPLQMTTARVTGWILMGMGRDVTVVGELVRHGDHLFHVIESCSGVRTILSMVMASFVYIEIFPRPRRRAILLVASSPLVGLAVNQLRILSIIFNPFSDFAIVHDAQGVFMMAIGVLMLTGVDSLLGRLLPGPAYRSDPAPGPPQAPAFGRQLGLLLCSLVLAGFTLGVAPWVAPPEARKGIARLPGHWADWHERGRRAIDREFFGTVGFDRCVLRPYKKDDDVVNVLMCSDRRLVHGNRMLSPKLRLPGPGWGVERSGPVALGPDGPEAGYSLLRTGGQRQLVYFWQVEVASPAVEIVRGTLSLDRGPLHRPERALVVRIGTALGEHDSFEDANERLLRFIDDFRAPLTELGALPSTADDRLTPDAGLE
jgi:exosortase